MLDETMRTGSDCWRKKWVRKSTLRALLLVFLPGGEPLPLQMDWFFLLLRERADGVSDVGSVSVAVEQPGAAAAIPVAAAAGDVALFPAVLDDVVLREAKKSDESVEAPGEKVKVDSEGAFLA